ncbi:hypothetical protein DNTS_034676 [Danionella cerebrum]|uniref:Cell division cycle-associated protein 3 n=1 Tax=Danionella cerebrum TaxID=2873325 RepID=A0A553QYW1_9TELE|nr:hypothetical protein DNTS_034676 [Danionella translucida]
MRVKMGASESKLTVESTPKVEPNQRPKPTRVARLADPRSPSCAIDRTPIQVGVTHTPLPVMESKGLVFVDPRSPTPGITRTPMKVSVTSLARRLSTFFLNDVKSGDSPGSPLPPVVFTKHSSRPSVDTNNPDYLQEPLLKPLATMPSPVPTSPSEGYGSICSSPFVLIGEVEVNEEVEASLEEAEEALLLEERPLTPIPPAVRRADEEHSYAVFTIAPRAIDSTRVEEAGPILEEVQAQTHTEQTEEVPETSSDQQEKIELSDAPSSDGTPVSKEVELEKPVIPSLKIDPWSPSQAIFKPQWLGVGFGTTGVRARGVQGRMKTSVPSPLASVKTAKNENNNMVVRSKPRPREKVLIGEGRSPLKVLREANSPRERNLQKKLKVSTPDKQRISQMDRRALRLSLDKENDQKESSGEGRGDGGDTTHDAGVLMNGFLKILREQANLQHYNHMNYPIIPCT